MKRTPFSLDAQILGLMVCIGMPLSTFAVGLPAVTAQELHKGGKYAEAAVLGIEELRAEPKNYELRFLVADSLQRAGQLNEAKLQFEALGATPLSEAATFRLNALKKSGSDATQRQSRLDRGVASLSGMRSLSAYQYVPPVNATLTGSKSISNINPPQVSPAPADLTVVSNNNADIQKIRELNAAGDYTGVGTAGLALLAKGKTDESLQLIIANSLAWTGRTKEAAPAFRGLLKGKYAIDAKVGLANVERWQGRDDKAMPLYQEVVAADPTNAGALEGLELATREMVPRTSLIFGRSLDTSNMERGSATVNHRWRDRSGSNVIEVETDLVRDELPPAQASQQDVTFRYKALALALKPSLELSMPTKGSRTLYGKAHLTFDEYRANLDVGRVNWGKLAINPNALASQLAADTVGADITQETRLGDVTGRVDYFDISDGNKLVTSSLRLASNWRPLGSKVKPFAGLETRDVSFQSPSYWSPKEGFGSAYGGLIAEWGQANWNWFVTGQVGFPLYGESGTSWSMSAGGTRWLNNEYALGVRLWGMESRRDNSKYGAQAITIQLDKLWR